GSATPSSRCCLFFFFQAEDGIRDRNVTGVQTCALPIFLEIASALSGWPSKSVAISRMRLRSNRAPVVRPPSSEARPMPATTAAEIGRASCRGREGGREREGGGETETCGGASTQRAVTHD